MNKAFAFRGFTLLEILLALFIFALVMVMVTSGYGIAIRAQKQLNEVSDQLERLQIAEAIMTRDLSQMINRPIVDTNGEVLASLIVHPNEREVIEFTRNGVINPQARDTRSSMIRVGYDLIDGQLIRKTWRVLDRAPSSEPDSQVILNQVQNLTFRWLDKNEFVLAQGNAVVIPEALLFELKIGDKILERIIRIPGAEVGLTSSSSQSKTNPEDKNKDDDQSSTASGEEN